MVGIIPLTNNPDSPNNQPTWLTGVLDASLGKQSDYWEADVCVSADKNAVCGFLWAESALLLWVIVVFVILCETCRFFWLRSFFNTCFCSGQKTRKCWSDGSHPRILSPRREGSEIPGSCWIGIPYFIPIKSKHNYSPNMVEKHPEIFFLN